MTELRKNLPGETSESGRKAEAGMGYVGDQADVLLFSHVLRCLEHGQVPSVLVASDDEYRSIVHDLTGNRSDLWRDTHSDTARIGRAKNGIPREKLFWTRGRPAQTVLLDEKSVIDRIVDLHERFGGDLGQLLLFIESWGETVTLQRPPQMSDVYPEAVTVVPMPPPKLMHYGIEGAKRLIRIAIAARQLAREMTGATELEPEEKRPLYLGADADAVDRAYQDYAEFCEQHRRAYLRFRRGRRNVTFPAGTVFWRCRANVNVEEVARQ